MLILQNIFSSLSYEQLKKYISIFKFYPTKINYIREFKEALLKLRKTGREQIMNRMKDIQDEKNITSDLLAVILKKLGNFHKFY